MEQRIGVGRAARMLGIDRHDLQQLIHDGKLECFEGQVDLMELRRRYPGLIQEESPILEQVRTLKDTAFARRVRDVATPDTDSLAAQLRKLNAQLAIEEFQHKKYRSIVEDLVRRLNELRPDASVEQRMLIIDLCCWISERVEP